MAELGLSIALVFGRQSQIGEKGIILTSTIQQLRASDRGDESISASPRSRA